MGLRASGPVPRFALGLSAWGMGRDEGTETVAAVLAFGSAGRSSPSYFSASSLWRLLQLFLLWRTNLGTVLPVICHKDPTLRLMDNNNEKIFNKKNDNRSKDKRGQGLGWVCYVLLID